MTRRSVIGVSAGGFASVALTADPPQGLVAAISFAGGRGSLRNGEVCRGERLVEAYRLLGKRSRTPMLWIYARNDDFFGPELAQKLRNAFAGGGGIVEFVTTPAFGSDGHGLFSPAGIPVWSGPVDEFLQRQGLVLRAAPLPPLARPALSAPAMLTANGRKAFETYLISAPHKAFAVSPAGGFGWRSGQRTTAAARSGALEFCRRNALHCDVMFIDDAPVSGDGPRAR